jgi:hypothetical protein
MWFKKKIYILVYYYYYYYYYYYLHFDFYLLIKSCYNEFCYIRNKNLPEVWLTFITWLSWSKSYLELL